MHILRFFNKGNTPNIIRNCIPVISNRTFAVGTRSRSRAGLRKSKSAPPPAITPELAWKPVLDKPSGLYYYWNTVTDETTHVGADNPALAYSTNNPGEIASAQPQQGGGMMSGLGGVVAQGMAFGMGSSIAHHAVGSIMGGGGGGGSSDSGGDVDYSNQSPMDDGLGGGFSDDFDL